LNLCKSTRSYKKEKTAGKLPGKMPGRSKTDSRYWHEGNRLFKDGSPDFSCRFSFRGKRKQIALGLPNKKQAAVKAAEIYTYLVAHGWEETLLAFKGAQSTGTNVGDVICKAVSLSSARPRTLDAYTKAFRKIVSEIEKISDADKFDSKGDGAEKWRKRVDAVPLERITPKKLIKWKAGRIREHQDNPVKRNQAIVTVNSLIRNAKALFGKKMIGFLRKELELPEELPFDGVTLEKSPSLRYHSTIDATALFTKAHEELSAQDAEAFKVFLLALVCGLRRSEIDSLLWSAFDFTNRILRIENNQYHELKSEDSAGELDLDEANNEIFKAFAQAGTDFVIKSEFKPSNQRSSRSYRCDAVFNRLNVWLKANGVNTAKPTHTLRKEIGSIIASQYGIFEASRYLRHSDIRITAAFYADRKRKVTPTLGLANTEPSSATE